MIIENYTSRLSSDRFVIFLLHGVIKDNISSVRNYNRKHILESEFYDLLKELKKNGNPVSMDYFLNGNPLPQKAYAITFDDGFENNYSIAAPILRNFNTSATFYITSSFIENNKMSWVDQIDYAIEKSKKEKIEFLNQWFDISTTENKIEFLKCIRQRAKGCESFFLILKGIF